MQQQPDMVAGQMKKGVSTMADMVAGKTFGTCLRAVQSLLLCSLPEEVHKRSPPPPPSHLDKCQTPSARHQAIQAGNLEVRLKVTVSEPLRPPVQGLGSLCHSPSFQLLLHNEQESLLHLTARSLELCSVLVPQRGERRREADAMPKRGGRRTPRPDQPGLHAPWKRRFQRWNCGEVSNKMRQRLSAASCKSGAHHGCARTTNSRTAWGPAPATARSHD